MLIFLHIQIHLHAQNLIYLLMREIYIHFYVQQTLWAQIMNKKTEKKKTCDDL